MRCRKARHNIDLRLDHELREKYVSPLERHLSGCAACRAYQAKAQSLDTLLRSQQAPEFPTWLHHQILDQAAHHDNLRVAFRRRWRLSTIPALLALVLSLTIGSIIGKAIYGAPDISHNRDNQITASDKPASQVASFGESTLIEDFYDNGEPQ